MAVLYPKIVNVYTKFAQNCVDYKRNFSVLLRKHHTACEKRTAAVFLPYGHVGLTMYCNKLTLWKA